VCGLRSHAAIEQELSGLRRDTAGLTQAYLNASCAERSGMASSPTNSLSERRLLRRLEGAASALEALDRSGEDEH
jgi:hypothetical protein